MKQINFLESSKIVYMKFCYFNIKADHDVSLLNNRIDDIAFHKQKNICLKLFCQISEKAAMDDFYMIRKAVSFGMVIF